MHSVAFAVPINPGRSDAWKQYVTDLTERWRNEYEASKRKFGIRREAAWLQQTPQGDLAILYQDVENPELAKQELSEVMNSDEEFYVWKRQNYSEIFGMDPRRPAPEPPELLIDHRV